MEISNNDSKRNRIIEVDYVFVSDATVRDYPGRYIQILVSAWNPMKYSSVDFTESDPTNGNFIDQELSINLFGSDLSTDQIINNVTGREVLIRLKYATGIYKVIGTEDNPVLLMHSSSGSPVLQSLSCSRKSAEKAKIPTS